MLQVKKAKKVIEKTPVGKRKDKSHQQEILELTEAQMDAIRKMESQEPAGPMVSSLLDF